MGLDGGVGYPAYSGLLSNPMMTSALITARESSVAGDAAARLYGVKIDRGPWLDECRVDFCTRFTKEEGLQPNVRAALAEIELIESLRFKADTHGAQLHYHHAEACSLVRIQKLPDSLFDTQLQLVEAHTALRAERMAEVLSQVVPQSAYWSAIAGLTPDRHRYTWELIGIGLRFTMLMVMRMKYHFNVARPSRRSAIIQPMILTPGYTAYPCGHAAEASFVAEFLPLLAGDPTLPGGSPGNRPDGMARQLNRLAHRVAENRVVAGLHFPVDSIAGQVLGTMLARHMVWLAEPGAATQLRIGAEAFPNPAQVDPQTLPEFDCYVEGQPKVIKRPDLQFPTASGREAPMVRALWTLARREWIREE
ncbi:MAG: hypothetical protein V4864_17005 [Pseudomonadota bacterium]